MRTWIEFNIHDRATMRVAHDAPTAALMAEMFEPFLAHGLDHYDLTITGEREPVADVAHAGGAYDYTTTSLYIRGTKVQIALDDQGFRLHGTRELLVTALPLLDRILVRRGVATIHAATVDYRGHGLCLPAWGATGKTSTVAKLLRLDGMSFMGDDWAFLSTEGDLLGYAKPMFIKAHHRPIYPHLFHNKRKPLVPSVLTGPLETVSTAVHPLITQYPRLASFSRKWTPEHMKVSPRQAFPHATFSTRADLAATVFMERHDGARPLLQEQDTSWMISRLIGNFHAEIGSHSQEVMTALAATGLVPLEQVFSEKAAVLQRALAGKPAFLLQVPKAYPPDRASDVMVEHLQKVLGVCNTPLQAASRRGRGVLHTPSGVA